MKKRINLCMSVFLLTLVPFMAFAQSKLVVNTLQEESTINKHIYGHFAEHLGRNIYGGIWVGPDSSVPNEDGYRLDVMQALIDLEIPNLRWPGGCFADEYHWTDGIGDPADRPKMVNTHWGGVTEDNSFGTHEFLNFVNKINTEAYITGNVGSGSVEEMSKWIEYINFDGVSPMAELRKKNGQEEPWNLTYWGVGNESWGCGGNMTPEYYANEYRRYATYARDYGGNKLYKIAGGANNWDLNWTEVLMKTIPLEMMDGLSLHYYTVTGSWENKGSATDFDKEEYLETLNKAAVMDDLIAKHSQIMDKYDPEKKVGLIIDEWGTWFKVEPGTNPGFLYQQNTMRDAHVAAITLNIFNKHADRVHMANLAQTVNVLQAIILTSEDDMILTPTYHVFDLYKPHKDAKLLPHFLATEKVVFGEQSIEALQVSTSKSEDGTINISIANVHPDKKIEIDVDLIGMNATKAEAAMVSAPQIDSYNTFEDKDVVKKEAFKDFKLNKNSLKVTAPANSVIMIQVK
ncbi:alpha-N-arabinofuranosidase [Mongoliibacter ruber]|uniref:non-reducing end alpha-L-arabinofuranosidase n=1 Tax=Mongoliibacter ruber TaxID=1750599 RepID=A0A2T0WAS1_9BACT|nr:alpha-L-arabinofuranosidase C-terminal domain-containing protein [Mongoliibacter ruber]PRY83798.1 alpha-N-arabinofuranosidase [Mongoliibacter ruber]